MSTTRLNLACGSNYREGWVNLDVVAWPGYRPPDRYWDARHGSIPFPNGSVREIYAGFLLLHLYPRFRPAILAEMARVLIPGQGRLEVCEVDMVQVLPRWLANPTDKTANELIWGEVGSVHGADHEDFDRHTWGFSAETLRRLLQQAGLVGVKCIQVPNKAWYEMTLEAFAP